MWGLSAPIACDHAGTIWLGRCASGAADRGGWGRDGWVARVDATVLGGLWSGRDFVWRGIFIAKQAAAK